ncbi:MAG: nuclear transport factor 2 family protein [Pseudomonadales bacterium]|nr:nuclear transport factor 2 family protein [Pseudomonadales bacterium]
MTNTAASNESTDLSTELSTNFGEDEFASIMAVVGEYFHGLHQGDTKRLRAIFHADAFLKAPGLRRSLQDWLDAVATRPIPAQQGHPFSYKLLSVEVIKDQAMVKLECPLFDHAYVDFLGLLKEDGRWLIVNKMYTDLQTNLKEKV